MKSLYSILLRLCLLSAVFACGSSKSDDSASGTTEDLSDTSLDSIKAFIAKASFKTWTAEKSVHTSAGPHAMVKVYFNPTILTSLRNKSTTHPKGSILVKELYENDGTTLRGYALSVKTAEGTDANNWVWYEGILPSYANPSYGRGRPFCADCHVSGTDYVLSTVDRI